MFDSSNAVLREAFTPHPSKMDFLKVVNNQNPLLLDVIFSIWKQHLTACVHTKQKKLLNAK